VLYCYGEDDDVYLQTLDKTLVTPHKGIPTFDTIDDFVAQFNGEHVMCVLDDLSHEVLNEPEDYKVFTQKSHHANCNFLITFHSVFHRNKTSRMFTMNTHYLILTRNLRDLSTVSHLARQVFPGKSQRLVECYQIAMEQKLYDNNIPHALLLSFHPVQSTREFMVFSDFLGETGEFTVYQI
jgi:hypothetical protein